MGQQVFEVEDRTIVEFFKVVYDGLRDDREPVVDDDSNAKCCEEEGEK